MAAASVPKTDSPSGHVWQDKEIRFDSLPRDMVCRSGEFVIDSLNSVEDTKGNNGTRGSLRITNLRMIWFSHKRLRVNLSVGYSCIQTITIRSAPSKLRARAQALYLMTKSDSLRFEFIFTSLVAGSPRLFTTIQAVFRAYETSKLYRDLKLRGALVKDGFLKQLPDEEVFNKIDGIMNLSSDQGNLGTLYLTNIRVVWHATLAENFNVSIPWIQICAIETRSSKFGQAVALVTVKRSGGYVLGFQIDPPSKRDAVLRELQSLWTVYVKDPILGVKHTIEDVSDGATSSIPIPRREDDVEIVDSAETADTMAAYLADAAKTSDREPVFCADLGLAVESLPPGYTVSKLWTA